MEVAEVVNLALLSIAKRFGSAVTAPDTDEELDALVS